MSLFSWINCIYLFLCLAVPQIVYLEFIWLYFIRDNNFKFINPAHLESITGGDNKFKQELIDVFVQQMPILAVNLEKALQEKNYTQLGAIAHKTKSSVALMGIESLRLDMATLEKKTKTGEDIDSYAGIVTNFISVSTDVLSEIELLRQSIKNENTNSDTDKNS